MNKYFKALNEALEQGKLDFTTAENFLIEQYSLSRMEARHIAEAWVKAAGGEL